MTYAHRGDNPKPHTGERNPAACTKQNTSRPRRARPGRATMTHPQGAEAAGGGTCRAQREAPPLRGARLSGGSGHAPFALGPPPVRGLGVK